MIRSSSFSLTTVLRSGVVNRAFASSSDCHASSKLRCVFEEYRRENFSRETPTRFEKELAKALSPNGTVEVTQLNHFLVNIGRPDTLVSDAEFKNLLEEVGSRNRYIDTIAMLKRLVQ